MAARNRALRSDVDQAKDIYEEWMEPDWKASTTSTGASVDRMVVPKNRSKFKFAREYERTLSTESQARSSTNNSRGRRAKSAPGLGNGNILTRNWKAVDFERFYRWVTNGTLKDLYLAKKILFDDW